MEGSCALLYQQAILGGGDFNLDVVVHPEALAQGLEDGDLAALGYSRDLLHMNSGYVKEYRLRDSHGIRQSTATPRLARGVASRSSLAAAAIGEPGPCW